MHAIKKVAAIWIIFCTVIIASNFLHRPPPLRDTSEPSYSGCRYSLGWIRVFGSVCPDRNSLIRTPDQDSSEICICKSSLSINTVRRRSFVHFDIVTHDKKKHFLVGYKIQVIFMWIRNSTYDNSSLLLLLAWNIGVTKIYYVNYSRFFLKESIIITDEWIMTK